MFWRLIEVERYPRILRQCSQAEWDCNKPDDWLGGILNVFCASHLACVPCIVQVISQTSFGLHSQTSQKLRKNWLSLKYKQMELFSCTSKTVVELFMYTPFIVQTFMTGWFWSSLLMFQWLVAHFTWIVILWGCIHCTSIIKTPLTKQECITSMWHCCWLDCS